MKILIVLTICFLIIYYMIKNNYICYNWIKEHFEPLYINQNNQYNQTNLTKLKNINCCLVEKKYLPNSDASCGGEFKYLFTKKTNEECDINLYNLNSNQQLLIDVDNNWSNNFCSANLKKLGSCRNINKECIDFVNKPFCDKYKMIWSDKTCHQPLEYKWIDPINNIIPFKQNITFKMF